MRYCTELCKFHHMRQGVVGGGEGMVLIPLYQFTVIILFYPGTLVRVLCLLQINFGLATGF